MLRDSWGRLKLPSVVDNYVIDDNTPTSPNIAAVPRTAPQEPAYGTANFAIRTPPAYYWQQKEAKVDLPTSLLTKSLQWFYVVATLTMIAVLIIKLIWEVLFMHFQ